MTEIPLILVVDDDPLLQRATVRLLNQAGYNTVQADDGETGLQAAHDQKPDLALLDVNLPGMSGVEVCRQIKAAPALSDCFVVLLSAARIDPLSQVTGLDGGADGYIARPVSNEELLARVRGLLRIKHAAEEKRRASEVNFRLAFENANTGMCLIDPHGRFLRANQQLGNMLGYEQAELENLNLTDITQADYQATALAFIDQALSGQTLRSEFESLYVDKQGRPVWGLVSSSLVQDPHGEPLYFILQVQDVTARKQAEDALRELNATLEQRVLERTQALAEANVRLQELDRLKSKFVSDVSHELRTPVTGLILCLDLIISGKPEKRAQYLTNAQAQAHRMKQLIEDILDLSRPGRNKAGLRLELIDLNALLRQVVATQQTRAEAAGLTLTFEPAVDLPAVRGDVNRLQQVTINLITNAINYTPAGTVRVRSIQQADRVGFEVADTGVGIAPDDQPHLFERFYRGQQASQSNVRGTGLGLSIVKEIIDWHDGQVEVRSEVGAGSTFTVWLPAHPDFQGALKG